ncbi:MAG: hypothetical protein IJE03_06660 [Ruminiclostridium sp.]|nr:hypothetical protein [Ruminiclostridium sp.]
MRKLPRSPWLTAFLLLLAGLVISFLALSLSGQGEVTWGETPSCSSGTPSPSC